MNNENKPGDIIRKHFGENPIELFPAGTIEIAHYEGDIRVIDKFKLESVSILPVDQWPICQAHTDKPPRR